MTVSGANHARYVSSVLVAAFPGFRHESTLRLFVVQQTEFFYHELF